MQIRLYLHNSNRHFHNEFVEFCSTTTVVASNFDANVTEFAIYDATFETIHWSFPESRRNARPQTTITLFWFWNGSNALSSRHQSNDHTNHFQLSFFRIKTSHSTGQSKYRKMLLFLSFIITKGEFWMSTLINNWNEHSCTWCNCSLQEIVVIHAENLQSACQCHAYYGDDHRAYWKKANTGRSIGTWIVIRATMEPVFFRHSPMYKQSIMIIE